MKQIKRAHLVGIKGVAMAALAVYLAQGGTTVTGSDVPEDFPTKDELDRRGIRVLSGFDASRVKGPNKPDVVYYTGAHNGRDNVEVQAAIQAGIPVYAHGVALGEIMQGSRQIVVAGSHGKTTTSAMIATLLTSTGLDPSYAIGCGTIQGLGAAGHKGKSNWFIAEGDEYVTDPGHDGTPRFLWLAPEILVVTNIDYDHPDVYANLEAVQSAFIKLKKKAATTIVNIDDAASRPLLHPNDVITYGFSPSAQFRISHVGTGDERMFFTLEERGVLLGEFTLKVPGNHNVSNATSAMVAAHVAGMSWDAIKQGLLGFTGTKRRFEKLGSTSGITWYDDYAHHPTEIAATLKSLREWYPKRHIVAIFQPHTYTRTKMLMREFSKSFTDADTVILTDIYASAREQESLAITGMTLVTETAKHHTSVYFGKDTDSIVRLLSKLTHADDIVICMGAGDIYIWEKELMRKMK